MPPRSITEEQVQQVLALRGKRTVRQIADDVGISTGNVCHIHNGTFRAVTNRELELAPGERYLDLPVRCRCCGGLLEVVPCRKCKLDGAMSKTTKGPEETCGKCGRHGPSKIKGRQVRCGTCGNFLRRTDQPSQDGQPISK